MITAEYPANADALKRNAARQFSAAALPHTGYGALDGQSTGCRPDVAGAPELATPGEARAFEQGYADHPRFIGPDSASYRKGYSLAAKREQVREDARGEDLWLARGGSGE